MNIVKISGGIGNQLFQYALYKELLYLGHKAVIDTSFYKGVVLDKNNYRDFILNKMGLECNMISLTFLKIIKRVCPIYKYICDDCKMFYPEVLRLKNTILDGYWQDERYFIDVADVIRTDYIQAMEKMINEKNRMLYNEIAACKNAVSVHVRGGDYLALENRENLGEICGKEYYAAAIDACLKKSSDCVFYVFTNDINRAENVLPQGNKYIFVNNSEADGIQDIFLMSKCTSHIIANSTFSWWGAWLDPNLSHNTFAPKVWSKSGAHSEICPQRWIRL